MPRLAPLLLSLGLLCSCAGTPPAPRAAQPQVDSRLKGASPEAPRPTLVTIEYGNAVSKASIQVDVASNDVYVDMTNSRARIDTVRTPAAAPVAPAAAAALPQGPSEQVIRHVNIDSSVREDNRRIVDASARAQGGDSTATLRVTASIRKAQDAFYKGRYEEAQILARQSIDTRPTPEGHALAGSIAWTTKDYPLARFHWKRALSLDPDFPGVAEMLARLPAEN